jgi:hypothetical protein
MLEASWDSAAESAAPLSQGDGPPAIQVFEEALKEAAENAMESEKRMYAHNTTFVAKLLIRINILYAVRSCAVRF